MSKSKTIKNIRRYFVYILVRGLYGAIYFLPFGVKSLIGKFAGTACFYLMRSARLTALSNIETAFPGITAEKADRIARASFRSMGMNVLEALHLPRMSKEDIKNMAEFENLDVFKTAMKEGKGLVVITGHLGNWEFFQAVMSVRGFPTTVIAQHYSNPWIDKMITEIRESSGVHVIVRRRGKEKEVMKSALDALKKGQPLGFLVDHYAKKGGIAVPFLGGETSTPSGPSIFAMRSDAPVLFGYAMRKNGKFKVKFRHPIKVVSSNNRDCALYLNAARFLEEVESEIKSHPEQWAWMHNFRRKHKKGIRRAEFENLPIVEIYSKKDCCLCDEAKNELSDILARYPFKMKVTDITYDSEKLGKYETEVPVVFIDGKKTSKLKFDKMRFQEKIIERLAEQ
ncbi:MAG: glutaredoxin family protein [Candidatus Schekmanbacteria bacterium]|nr:glutaredoxin family protein [Candidatus Schekmanbacteria bacterium]